MTGKTYIAIGTGVLVAAALAAGGYWWKVENQRRVEAQQRAEKRAKALDEGFRALGTKDRLELFARFRGQLDDLPDRDRIRREIPAWDSYRDRLSRCNDLEEVLSRAAAQKRYRDLGQPAAQGFALALDLFADVSAGAKKELDRMTAVLEEKTVSVEQLARLDRLRWRGEIHNATMRLDALYVDEFSQTLRLLALNAPAPADRLAAFRLASDAYVAAKGKPGVIRLEALMREARNAEDDAAAKNAMNATLAHLKLPLELMPDSAKKSDK
ncbi:MAG TPA: hypothetical protein VMJ34_05865 [Bryobacteraceae bacterium]|nr:hypothetical protein [Bryobacteraceae bacterium]